MKISHLINKVVMVTLLQLLNFNCERDQMNSTFALEYVSNSFSEVAPLVLTITNSGATELHIAGNRWKTDEIVVGVFSGRIHTDDLQVLSKLLNDNAFRDIVSSTAIPGEIVRTITCTKQYGDTIKKFASESGEPDVYFEKVETHLNKIIASMKNSPKYTLQILPLQLTPRVKRNTVTSCRLSIKNCGLEALSIPDPRGGSGLFNIEFNATSNIYSESPNAVNQFFINVTSSEIISVENVNATDSLISLPFNGVVVIEMKLVFPVHVDGEFNLFATVNIPVFNSNGNIIMQMEYSLPGHTVIID